MAGFRKLNHNIELFVAIFSGNHGLADSDSTRIPAKFGIAGWFLEGVDWVLENPFLYDLVHVVNSGCAVRVKIYMLGVSRRFTFRVVHLSLHIRVNILELHLILSINLLDTAVVA